MENDAKLLAELHPHESSAFPAALCEAIRLLESERFGELSDADIREITNYRTISLGGAEFFARAFTPGKEAAASLGLARRSAARAARTASATRDTREPRAGGSACR